MPTPTEELYSAISQAYDYFNDVLFDNTLPKCILTLQRSHKTMGYASHKRWLNTEAETNSDELAINPEYWLGWPLCEVMQTLCHEQCHVWQSYHGSPSRRTYHNKEWADKMVSIGLIPSTTGVPGGNKTGQKIDDYILLHGRFHKAYMKLIDNGYKLTWLDRLPARVPENYQPKVYTQDGWQTSLTGQPLARHDRSSATTDILGSELTSTEEAGDPPASVQEYLEDSGIIKIAAKASNGKEKYRCNGCSSQVWGKANLNIKCGDCSIPFTMA